MAREFRGAAETKCLLRDNPTNTAREDLTFCITLGLARVGDAGRARRSCGWRSPRRARFNPAAALGARHIIRGRRDRLPGTTARNLPHHGSRPNDSLSRRGSSKCLRSTRVRMRWVSLFEGSRGHLSQTGDFRRQPRWRRGFAPRIVSIDRCTPGVRSMNALAKSPICRRDGPVSRHDGRALPTRKPFGT